MSCDEDKIIKVKSGADVELYMVYSDDDEPPVPVDITDYEIYMDVYHPRKGTRLARAEIGDGITVTDASQGEYTVSFGSSASWPLMDIPVDIKYVNGGKAQFTDTFVLKVVKGLTQ